jgi:hypothetical protein
VPGFERRLVFASDDFVHYDPWGPVLGMRRVFAW